MARLLALLVLCAADRLSSSSTAGSGSTAKVRVLSAQKSRTRVYERPMHSIAMTSVYNYPSKADLASMVVTPSGRIETPTGGNLRVTPESLVQTTELHKQASVVHATQLDVLRAHQKEIAALRASEALAAKSMKGKQSMEEGSTVGSRAKRSWNANAAGVIPLTNLRDSQYVGPVGVGTDKSGAPQGIIRVVFDTGSTNLWISSTLCDTDMCASRSRFNPTESTTFSDPTRPAHLDITFGTGELKGPQGLDSFHVGPYVVKNQTFALIEQEVGQVFEEIPFEGILGLAFPSMSAHGVQPFFDTVMSQDVLHGHNEISFFMSKSPHEQSAVFFGGVDGRFFDGDITYFPVTQEHYWSVDVIDFKIGDVSHTEFIQFRNSGPRVSKLILDSGTTYFTAPPGLFQQVMDRLPSTSCSATASYPDLHYIMKDVDGVVHDITVPPSVYMVSTYGDGWCDLSFMEIPVPEKYGPAFIFGEVFMRHWYTVFNRAHGEEGTATVGFAPSSHPDAAAQQSIVDNNEISAWRKMAYDRSHQETTTTTEAPESSIAGWLLPTEDELPSLKW